MAFRTFFLFVVIFSGLFHAARAQNMMVSGNVRDVKGSAIPYATVRVSNSRSGTRSDTLGAFNIRVKYGDSLAISAVGFKDTILSARGNGPVSIVLQPLPSSLGEAIVSANSQRPGYSADEIAAQQIINGAFQDYINGAMYSSGTYVSSSYNPGARGAAGMVVTRIEALGPLNTINSGAMLPVVSHQEDTRGSRYLLKRFVPGVIVDKDEHVITDSTRLLNYDKIDGQLLIAHGPGNYLEVDKDKILAFAVKTEDTSFVFLNVPILSKVNYFLLIANGRKYSAYKSVKTKFVKANYTSNGLIETGHDYDEYVDKQTYFWVSKEGNAGVLELKKKSIREVFASEKVKVDAFFRAHRSDDIDDGFVRNLINYLNLP